MAEAKITDKDILLSNCKSLEQWSMAYHALGVFLNELSKSRDGMIVKIKGNDFKFNETRTKIRISRYESSAFRS